VEDSGKLIPGHGYYPSHLGFSCFCIHGFWFVRFMFTPSQSPCLKVTCWWWHIDVLQGAFWIELIVTSSQVLWSTPSSRLGYHYLECDSAGLYVHM
jgi:hypothetical protein